MFIAEAGSALGKSGLNRAAVFVGRGIVTQAEAERIATRMTNTINGD